MLAKENTKTYAFIDASNIIYGYTRAGWKMDFEKLAEYLKTRYKIQHLLYYAGLDPDNKKQLGFYEALQKLGYETRLVPVKRYSDGSRKGDVDARLAFEAMRFSSEYSSAVFLTGDGDYFWLLEYLLESGKDARLIGHSINTARDLKRLFGPSFMPLENIKHLVERNNIKR
jgi:uncharacterized LabA/DUF88 family protein